jgi:hypothetical protein
MVAMIEVTKRDGKSRRKSVPRRLKAAAERIARGLGELLEGMWGFLGEWKMAPRKFYQPGGMVPGYKNLSKHGSRRLSP